MVKKSVYKKGQALIEAIVAVIILALVWVAAVNVVIVSRASGKFAKHKTQADYAIQRTIENLRKQLFSSIVSSGPTAITIDTSGTPDYTPDDFTGIQIVTVTNTDPYYKKVVIKWMGNFFLFYTQ